MKQTAVEWLIKKLINRQNGVFDGLPYLSLDEIYIKAKEIEKKQIFEAHNKGYKDGECFSAEKYYKETYQ